MRVTCFGSNNDEPQELYKEMVRVGQLLAVRGVSIATGGFGGIGMQAPAEGSALTRAGVSITGYTYGGRAPNEYINDVVDCRALAARLPFDAEYCVRLAGLLSSDAFVVAGSGGPGTFLELVATINFNQKFWSAGKRVAILETNPKSSWGHLMLMMLKDWGVLNETVEATIRVSHSAEQAVQWVCEGIA
jgi:predicted Rossmann-fold nucleotide-binding protein